MKDYQWILGFVLLTLSSNAFAESMVGVPGDIALQRLVEGNIRFREGKAKRPNQSQERIREVSKRQFPFATIIGCSDSRVPNEIVFDQGLGDLFIVRTAGQVSTYASWGSIEFSVAVLGVNLVVVLGHSNCGAVDAACKSNDVPGHIITLTNAIKPAAEKTKHLQGDWLQNAVKANVALQVTSLRKLDPILSKLYNSGKILIVGAVYDLDTGKVSFLDEDYILSISK
ncbi:carbonic anhydrase [Leptospira sp. 2 VSF19]|uniref:Carbonic anhydrase n=1 Tax=Leptospira soteropolitanensis TaxID=2950025 RepID=A0AAW5VC40_9LEPT|nr:carbonic anhydrase [Leptospira soteropolitanensis]MCW7492690.1 carbonic anhydrase [Leptospira soteropolitanensis]MCW7500373.1 carbonic anhydrase [Leptospira soteropolitanensis]MCW7522592.1 carbonic anhydrase [Leptospira soteropolitanensis]MCW7526448.1 carbonic anhydrase [Leptospira soteropolitanensis]MCW7530343.1 carbonic anhydrase [Leptospira soteropolitanensis]